MNLLLLYRWRYAITILFLLNGHAGIEGAAVSRAADPYEGFVLVDVEDDEGKPVDNFDANRQVGMACAAVQGEGSLRAAHGNEGSVAKHVETADRATNAEVLPKYVEQVLISRNSSQSGSQAGGQAGESLVVVHVGQSQPVAPVGELPVAGGAEISHSKAIAAHIVALRAVTTNASNGEFNTRNRSSTGRMSPIMPMSPSARIVWPVLGADHDMAGQEDNLECSCAVISDDLYDAFGCVVHGQHGVVYTPPSQTNQVVVQGESHQGYVLLQASQTGVPISPIGGVGALDARMQTSSQDTQQETINGNELRQTNNDGERCETKWYLAQSAIIERLNAQTSEGGSVGLPAQDEVGDGRRRSRSHDAVVSAQVACCRVKQSDQDRAMVATEPVVIPERPNIRRSRRSMSYGSFSSHGSFPRFGGESISMEHPTLWSDDKGEKKQSQDGEISGQQLTHRRVDGEITNGQQGQASTCPEVNKSPVNINHGQQEAQMAPPAEREPRRCGLRHCCLL